MKREARNFLILSGSPESHGTQRIKEEALTRGHTVTILKPSDFYAHCSATISGHDKAFVKSRRIFRKEIDCVIPRISSEEFEFGLSILKHWTDCLKVPSTATAEGLRNASNKFTSIQLASAAKLQVPATTLVRRPEDFGALVDSVGGLPVVCKLLRGSGGRAVFILESELAGSTALQTLASQGIDVMLQQFIETSSESESETRSDIRAWVIDGQIAGAYQRLSLAEDFRSNFSQSGKGQKVVLTAEEKELILRAAHAVGLSGCCGLDIVRDANDRGRPYFIEANGCPGLAGVEQVTGLNMAGKIIDFAEELARRSKGKASTAQSLATLPSMDPRNRYLSPNTRRAMKKQPI